MKYLQLLPVGMIDGRLLEELGPALARRFRMPCELLPDALDPEFAFHAERQQYHSSEMLARMQSLVGRETWRLLAITERDLYIPILTFVFGEAQMGGPCAVVSSHRLTQEFYGLQSDRDLLRERLLKESVHEIGHTLQLTHCDDYRCVMASSHAVEWIDLKDNSLCPHCFSRALNLVAG
jgi:archaemetzincin